MRNFQFVEPTFQPRRTQLAICQSIYDANAFNIQNWKNGSEINFEMLPDSVITFLNLMKQLDVDFCIVGGIAYLAYIQDRNTKDLDILISVKDLAKLKDRIEVTNADVNFTNAKFENLQVDFLKTSNALFEFVKKYETTTYNFAEGEYPIATLNGLILMRFDAIIDLYQKGKITKAIYYERDLQILTVNFQVDWDYLWKVSAKFLTDGQINTFKKMVKTWQKPPVNPFA